MKLEETLNGGYAGLYGEVVTEDVYHLRQLNFVPDLIFDIGANVGIFARYARELFPEARIVSVEPHPENCAVFREHTDLRRTVLHQVALGNGPLYHGLTAANGSGETYLSAGLGYPLQEMEKAVEEGSAYERALIPAVRFVSLYATYFEEGLKTVAKIDCEGAENSIWSDPLSLAALRKIDYIAMELHYYAHTGGEVFDTMIMLTNKALKYLGETHDCIKDGVQIGRAHV